MSDYNLATINPSRPPLIRGQEFIWGEVLVNLLVFPSGRAFSLSHPNFQYSEILSQYAPRAKSLPKDSEDPYQKLLHQRRSIYPHSFRVDAPALRWSGGLYPMPGTDDNIIHSFSNYSYYEFQFPAIGDYPEDRVVFQWHFKNSFLTIHCLQINYEESRAINSITTFKHYPKRK